ncbi:F0F1 ATP synthase subunit gamma [Candidatus Poribacteria bacterium]|nr:F0F1 ATP synthase subunit gamma [Candidatus Poribacteria bacterium]
MQTVKELRNKIDSAEDLQSVVKTMKVLATISIQQYERAVESLDEYSRTIEMGLQVILMSSEENINIAEPDQESRIGIIVIGSEQGMSGNFNNEIVTFAADKIKELGVNQENRVTMSLGERITGRLEDEGIPIDEPMPFFPGSLYGIMDILNEILFRIEEWRFNRNIEKIILFHHKLISKVSYEPNMLQLLPVDREWLKDLKNKEWSSPSLPTFTMDWNQLFSALIREYLFVSLYQAFVESLASENASRLAAMQSAEKNIEERLEELNSQYHVQRQSAITAELLDIVAGFEAVSGN